MDYFFRFAHPWFGVAALGLIAVFLLIRYFLYRPVEYSFSLSSMYKKTHQNNANYVIRIPFILQLVLLTILAALIARPQLVDVRSTVNVEGIDILLLLDVSGSMQVFDDVNDQRPRFAVAKEEATRFIDKRDNDQIGLVLFGRVALSRCPLTLDKQILKDIIQNLELGEVNPDGTALGTAIAMGVQRLRNSKAQSKVMILLTDGEPTPEIDLPIQKAIELAQKFGIKIYTIGVGGKHGGLWKDPLFGVTALKMPLNKELLTKIAQETGGQFFHAQTPQDVARIYDIIDRLEKTEHEATIFSDYHELIVPVMGLFGLLLLLEKILTTVIWFVI